MKNTLKKASVFSFSLLLTILLIESYLRVVHTNSPDIHNTTWQNSGPFQIDPVLIYKNYPYEPGGEYWDNDQEGFRLNPKHQYAEENTTKIITIGDSFTYGHGVKNSETFPYLLEQKLNAGKLIATEEKTNGVLPEASKYLIHNAGTPGYGVDQEFLLIKQILSERQPQLIIWNLNVNDVGDSNYACLFKKTKNDQYQQISGRRNTLYLAESIKKIPMIDKSYLRMLLWRRLFSFA